MGGLWQRRAVRQILLGLVPLLVLGVAMLTVLAVRLAQVREVLDRASAKTEATVVRSGLGAEKHDIQVRWTDQRGVEHLTRLTFPHVGRVEAGRKDTLHYDPNDTDTVWMADDSTIVRYATIANGVTLVAVLLLVGLVSTAVRVARRRSVERRPEASRQFTVAHSRWGLVTRTWLRLREGEQSWWVPVYWDPALDTVNPRKAYPVHGLPDQRSLLVAQVNGTPIWPAGRRRSRQPRGEVVEDPGPRAGGPREISLLQHFRGDVALLLAAPLLGLLWAYLDESGASGFWVSTAVFVGVMFWITSLYASDPT
jgi:hypothetical protein